MRLPVAKIQMASDDFRRYHQHALLRTGPHQIDRDVQTGRRRGAAKPHVEAGAVGAESVLNFDRNRRWWCEAAQITMSISAPSSPAWESARFAEAKPNSASSDSASSGRAGILGAMRAGSRMPSRSMTCRFFTPEA